MKIIQYRNSDFSQTAEPFIKDYKLSLFCIGQKTDDGMLLCNAMTGALVLLTNTEYDMICSRKPLTEDWAITLASLGYLPNASADECALVDQKRMQVCSSDSIDNAITFYTILPTSQCNARCFYCYENGIQQKNMSQKTAEDTAAFIAHSCKGQEVHLGWFGGEPTIAHPIITQICQDLRERNVVFRSGMISNGLLLNYPLIQTAVKQWNLKHIQITLDGTQEVYNATKNYIGALENPFGIVISNIELLLNAQIRVSVRINLGIHNYEDVSALIHQLSLRFPRGKGLKVYVHEIDNYYDDDTYSELIGKTRELNETLVQLNLQDLPELPALRVHSCMADNDRSVLINPDGQLGKCEHFVFEKLHGSIYSDSTDVSIINQWKEPVRFEQCGMCPFYASCLRLKWCNGGSFFCRDGLIQNKLKQTRNTMLRLYEKWMLRRSQFRETDRFRLIAPCEIVLSDKQYTAVFPSQRHSNTPATIPVNQTSQDILNILQNQHTLSEIVDLLEDKYDTSGFAVADIVEEYLLFLIHDGLLCVERKKDDTL